MRISDWSSDVCSSDLIRHGNIGMRDFRGEVIRAYEDAGWIFHSEVCIWKDPVVAQQRTKSIRLLHKQIVKDSTISGQGLADYIVTFRKPGENAEPVSGCFDEWHGEGDGPDPSKFTTSTDGRNWYSIEVRSEEHTSELQSLMRISYAVFCLKKKNQTWKKQNRQRQNKHKNKPQNKTD